MGNLKSQAEALLLRLSEHVLTDAFAVTVGPLNCKKDLAMDLKRLKARVRSEGISFLTKTLPSFAKHFELCLELGFWRPLPGFARQGRKKGPLPRFLGGLVSLVFCSQSGLLLDNPLPSAVAAVRQICYAFYKLIDTPTKEQAEKAIASYKATESDLPAPEKGLEGMSLCDKAVICSAVQVVTALFEGFDVKDIIPRHGPGAVATGEKGEGKWNFGRLYSGLHELYPWYDYGYASRNHFLDSGLEGWKKLERASEGVSKYIFVPKDSRGPRGISMEPLEFQYFQQGLLRSIVRRIEAHSLTRGHVCFTDQHVNQRRALRASCDRREATIDMKDASDRISLWLVRQLFKGVPDLLRALEATRSARTELPNGEVLPLRKFAPMGSALCFPVEAICFFALIISIMRVEQGYSLQEAASAVYVFGDDIIVPSSSYTDVTFRLQKFSLRVNTSKSFYIGSFRESCGVDAYAGVDVTPARFRRVLSPSGTIGPQELAAIVSTRNQLYLRGYERTCRHLDDIISQRFGRFPEIPIGIKWEKPKISWDDAGRPHKAKAATVRNCRHMRNQSSMVVADWQGLGLASWSATGVKPNGCPTRYNHRYQRVEVRVPVIQPVMKPSSLDGWSAVQRFLLQGTVDQYPTGSSAAPHLVVKRRWIGIDYSH